MGTTLGRITFSDKSLNEHAAGPTTPSPNQDRFSNRDHGYDSIISEGGHLDPVRISREGIGGMTYEESFVSKISQNQGENRG